MDSITQAALGASIAGLVAGKILGRPVLLTGAIPVLCLANLTTPATGQEC